MTLVAAAAAPVGLAAGEAPSAVATSFEISVVLLIPVIFTVARRLEAAGPDPGGHNTHLLISVLGLVCVLGPDTVV
jgi:hypothetical protein